MNGFARRKEQSKEDVRKAAWQLFSQFGVERVSVADIARKAGVAPATIYNNFGSKETLVREFVTAMVDQLVQRVQAVLAPDRPYPEKMQAFFQFISDALAQEMPSEANSAMFTSSPELRDDPEIGRIRDSAREKMTNLLLGLVQEGKAQGWIHGEISEDAYRIYFALFMDIFAHPSLQRRFQRNPRLVHDLESLMMYGLGGHL